MLLSRIIITFVISISVASACSNIVISSGASADLSVLIAYNADSASLYGSLYHYPSAEHSPNAMREIYDWDSGRYLGQIKEVQRTYNVVGNMNEYGLVIGETTFGGISALQSQLNAKIDYGSLIWVTLQRAKTAKEAILTIAELMETYGYASEGETFSIGDPHEAWIMEIIGKGNYEMGAVWVAMKVPEGFVTGHANQARITTFPLNDPENCIYAKDTISFARNIGIFSSDLPDEQFSFSDVYDPVTFSGARFCEARVWSFFSSVMGMEWSNQYLDYAQGYNLTNRMPLFVKPLSKVSLQDTMEYMRNHYEKLSLDMTGESFQDVGASFSATPVRAHPLTWTSTVNPDGSTNPSSLKTYLNERPIATQQTGWNFVAQCRHWLPRELRGVLWFGVDDSATTVRFPIYASSTRIPLLFEGKGPQDGVVPNMMTFSLNSAFYVFNLVANWAYSRWDLMYPLIHSKIISKESEYIASVALVDEVAWKLYLSDGPSAAVEYVTKFSVDVGDALVKEWTAFFGQLFVMFRDGYQIKSDSTDRACGCSVSNGAYPQAWLDRIVTDTGDHYFVPENVSGALSKKLDKSMLPVDKERLLRRK